MKYYLFGFHNKPKNGRIDVTIIPCADICHNNECAKICRAGRIDVAKTVIVESTDVPAMIEKDIDES